MTLIVRTLIHRFSFLFVIRFTQMTRQILDEVFLNSKIWDYIKQIPDELVVRLLPFERATGNPNFCLTRPNMFLIYLGFV